MLALIMDVHSHPTGVPLDHLWFVNYIAGGCVSETPIHTEAHLDVLGLRFSFICSGMFPLALFVQCHFYIEGVPRHSMCGLMLWETIHTADAWGNPFPNSRVLDSRVVSSFQLL